MSCDWRATEPYVGNKSLGMEDARTSSAQLVDATWPPASLRARLRKQDICLNLSQALEEGQDAYVRQQGQFCISCI